MRARAILLHPLGLSLALLCGISGYLYWTDLFAGADALQAFAYFSNSLSNVLKTGEFPQWMPQAAFGSPAEPYAQTFLGPFQIVAILAGALVRDTNAWRLFFLSIVAETAFFLASIHLLARDLFRSRLAGIALCLAAVLTVHWHVQIFWSYRVLIFVPLLLFSVLRFHHTGDFAYLWQTGIAGTFALLGSLAYLAPIYLLIGVVLYGSLQIFDRRWPDRRTLLRPASAVWAVVMAAGAGLELWLLGTAFTGTVIFATGRNADGTVGKDIFLDYGGHAVEKLPEFILGGMVQHVEFFFYVGFAAVVLGALAVWRVRTAVFRAMLVLTVFLFLLALGRDGLVAHAVYYFPMANRFRHLAYLLPMVRFLLLVLAAFGVDHLIAGPRRPGRPGSMTEETILASVVGAGFLGLKWLVFSKLIVTLPFRFTTEIGILAAAAALVVAWRLPPAVRHRMLAGGFVVAMTADLLVSFMAPLWGSDYRWKNAAVRSVHDNPFRPRRALDFQAEPRIGELRELLRRQVVSNSTVFLLTGIEPCVPFLRLDFVTAGVERLTRKHGRADGPDEVAKGAQWRTVLQDENFRRIAGCSAPKLWLRDGAVVRDLGPDVRDFSANHLQVAVTSTGGGVLGYADGAHSGWRAAIDGAPVPIEPFEDAFKSVQVPPGNHLVAFSFYDWRREWARCLLGVGCIPLLIGIFWVNRRAQSQEKRDTGRPNPEATIPPRGPRRKNQRGRTSVRP